MSTAVETKRRRKPGDTRPAPSSLVGSRVDRQTRAGCHRTVAGGPRPFRFRHFQCLSSVLARPQGFKVSPRGEHLGQV